MEWSIFAIVQTLVIAFGVSIALWLRIRAVNKQNDTLRVYCESLRTAETASSDSSDDKSQDWSNELINALDPGDPLTPLQRIVLEHATEPKPDLADQLRSAMLDAGLIDAEVTAAADPSESDAQTPVAESGDSASLVVEQDELRALLRQFTQDSREMMLCIQTLEKENAALLSQLAELGVTPVEVESPYKQTQAEDTKREAPVDSKETDTEQGAQSSTDITDEESSAATVQDAVVGEDDSNMDDSADSEESAVSAA